MQTVLSNTTNFAAVATTSGTTSDIVELRANAKGNVASLKALTVMVTKLLSSGGGGGHNQEENVVVYTHAKTATRKFITRMKKEFSWKQIRKNVTKIGKALLNRMRLGWLIAVWM